MSDVLIVTQPVIEDCNAWFFARLVDAFGTPLTTASVQASGVSLNVYKLDSPTVATPVLTLSSLDPLTTYTGQQLMTDTLQTTGWSKDSVGRNFAYMPTVSSFTPDGGTVGGFTYRYEFRFALTAAYGSGFLYAVFETPVISLLSS